MHQFFFCISKSNYAKIIVKRLKLHCKIQFLQNFIAKIFSYLWCEHALIFQVSSKRYPFDSSWMYRLWCTYTGLLPDVPEVWHEIPDVYCEWKTVTRLSVLVMSYMQTSCLRTRDQFDALLSVVSWWRLSGYKNKCDLQRSHRMKVIFA